MDRMDCRTSCLAEDGGEGPERFDGALPIVGGVEEDDQERVLIVRLLEAQIPLVGGAGGVDELFAPGLHLERSDGKPDREAGEEEPEGESSEEKEGAAKDMGIDLVLGTEDTVAQQIGNMLKSPGLSSHQFLHDRRLVLIEHSVKDHYSGIEKTLRELKGATLLVSSPDGATSFEVKVRGFPLFGGHPSDDRLHRTGRVDLHVAVLDGNDRSIGLKWKGAGPLQSRPLAPLPTTLPTQSSCLRPGGSVSKVARNQRAYSSARPGFSASHVSRSSSNSSGRAVRIKASRYPFSWENRSSSRGP